MRRTLLIWFVAFNFRTVIFSVPPVLPEIRSQLHLSFALAGSITSITLLCIGLGSLPGAVLGNRFGPSRLVGYGSVAVVAGGAARLLMPGNFWVPVGTAVATLAISSAQPSLSALIRIWFPQAIQRASSIYVNGQMAGGLAAFALTPFLVPWLHWQGALLLWVAVTLLGGLLWLRLLPLSTRPTEAPRPVWHALREPNLWLAAAVLTTQNATFFTAATFLPFLLQRSGAAYMGFVFFLMNGAALLPVLLAATHWRFASSVTFYVASGLVAGAGAILLLLGLTNLAWLAGFAIGLGTAMSYTGTLSIVPHLARGPEDVAGNVALVITVGYIVAFVGPLAGGRVIDVTHQVPWSFWPSLVSAGLMTVLGFAAIRFRKAASGAITQTLDAVAQAYPE